MEKNSRSYILIQINPDLTEHKSVDHPLTVAGRFRFNNARMIDSNLNLARRDHGRISCFMLTELVLELYTMCGHQVSQLQ